MAEVDRRLMQIKNLLNNTIPWLCVDNWEKREHGKTEGELVKGLFLARVRITFCPGERAKEYNRVRAERILDGRKNVGKEIDSKNLNI